MNHKTLFGITFPEETAEAILQACQESWEKKSRFRIATANPEYVMAAERTLPLKQNIQKAEHIVVDGFGLWAALRLQGWQGQRITGVQLTEALLPLAEREQRSVLIILKKGGLSSLAKKKEVLLEKYPKILLTVLYETELSHPQSLQYDVVLVATGIPHQEYLGEKIPTGVVMGVGGAIDFMTGAQKRAPKMLQVVGLEWLWRLLLQPQRFGRIINAVILFPGSVLVKRIYKKI